MKPDTIELAIQACFWEIPTKLLKRQKELPGQPVLVRTPAASQRQFMVSRDIELLAYEVDHSMMPHVLGRIAPLTEEG